jgi:hypothetical protein
MQIETAEDQRHIFAADEALTGDSITGAVKWSDPMPCCRCAIQQAHWRASGGADRVGG